METSIRGAGAPTMMYMHFFYMDESGDTGANLDDVEQPILVLGGIDVKDAGWMTTQSKLAVILDEYFDNEVPAGFELHASDLLSPQGSGHFEGHQMDRRTGLAHAVLNLITDRRHSIHYFAVSKPAVEKSTCDAETVFDSHVPWLAAYDYLITYLNWYVRQNLGHTARGMIIHDEKGDLHESVERISHERRFEGPAAHRVKWIVEFSYPVDSKKNPMIQISDLVTYCTRKFLEIENGYRDEWSDEAKRFYAECFRKVDDRVKRKGLVERGGTSFKSLNEHLHRIRAKPRRTWRSDWFG